MPEGIPRIYGKTGGIRTLSSMCHSTLSQGERRCGPISMPPTTKDAQVGGTLFCRYRTFAVLGGLKLGTWPIQICLEIPILEGRLRHIQELPSADPGQGLMSALFFPEPLPDFQAGL